MKASQPPSLHFRYGTDDHKQAFCAVLLNDIDPNLPTTQPWPTLSPEILKRFADLPFWEDAVEREGNTTCRMQALADRMTDPLAKKAMAQGAFDAGRLKVILRTMLRFYGIAIPKEKSYGETGNLEGLFLHTGYGECFDGFFLFGLFKLAKDSRAFPPELLDLFEPILQEQVRHILFFVNWLDYMEVNKGLIKGTWLRLRGYWFLMSAAYRREMLFKKLGLSSRVLIEASLIEHNRRLAPFNPALSRPKIVPFFARIVLSFLKKRKRS